MITARPILHLLYSIIALLWLAGIWSISSFSNASERVELYDSTLQDFVEWSSLKLNKSVVIGSDLGAVPVSIFANYENNAELEKLLENAVVSSGFHFSNAANVIRISSASIPEQPDLITDVIQLQHLQSDFAFQSVRDVLASRSDAAGDRVMVSPSPTSNAIIVTATAEQIAVLRQVVSEIDRPRRQVVITAVVAELSDNDFESLGLNVGISGDHLQLGGVSLRSSDRSDLGLSLTFTGPTLSAFLQAVKSTGQNRILSTPQILTLNREPASIVVGQNVPFITGQTTSGSTPASDPFQTIVRQDVGVTLQVTPYITPSDAIELQVLQSASSVSNDKTAADIITNTRKITTRVHLRDGEGVLLGGLRSEQDEDSISRIPGLSSIPLVGRLFQYTSRRAVASNLVVLLTARIHGEGDAVPVSDAVRPLVVPMLGAGRGSFGAAGAAAAGAQ